MPYLTTLTPPSSLPALPLEPLTPDAFRPFGSVITIPSASSSHAAITVNQGSATKHPKISPFTNSYPSASPASSPNLNLFVCRPRTLTITGEYHCGVLERHPYTSQTFIPLPGPRPTPNGESVKWVVIVAPTLEDGKNVGKGKGLPDLKRAKAFVVNETEAKAVTYAAGTWHAPMVVVGGREIAFVVAVNENGVHEEDVEEVEIGEGGLRVRVEMGGGLWKSKL